MNSPYACLQPLPIILPKMSSKKLTKTEKINLKELKKQQLKKQQPSTFIDKDYLKASIDQMRLYCLLNVWKIHENHENPGCEIFYSKSDFHLGAQLFIHIY
jgi:hypothetical protein